MGKIKDVIIIKCNFNYNKAFINYNEWYDNEFCNNIRKILGNGENIKLYMINHPVGLEMLRSKTIKKAISVFFFVL